MSQPQETPKPNPICANCKHAIKPFWPWAEWRCGLPELGDAISGEPKTCWNRRFNGGVSDLCGLKALFFEGK